MAARKEEEEEEVQDRLSSRHRFVPSEELRKRLEARGRRASQWGRPDVRGIPEENDALLQSAALPRAAPAEGVSCPPPPPPISRPAAAATTAAGATTMATEFCVCNCDSLSAALELGSGALVLNFANESTPGGRYRSGGRAQEEDLCRLLPQLAPSLEDAARQEPTRQPAQPGSDSCTGSGWYPIPPGTALVSRDLVVAREPGSYRLLLPSATSSSSSSSSSSATPKPPPPLHMEAPVTTVITAAMPCGLADRRPRGGWLAPGGEWADTVRLRIRSVLHAAREENRRRRRGRRGASAPAAGATPAPDANDSVDLVLGAFGCGAFGNPAGPVAAIFRELLTSHEFRPGGGGSSVGSSSSSSDDTIDDGYDDDDDDDDDGGGWWLRRVVFAIIDPVGTGNLLPFRKELKGMV